MDRLLSDIDAIAWRGDPGVEVTAVCLDSRSVRPGTLFCCVPGQHRDGHDFAAAAVAAGATGLLVERPLDVTVTQAVVGPGGVRPALARAACALEGHPARSLTTVGVTGTNGKTTVTHLLRAVLGHAGRPTEVIGTLDGARTTPEAPDLQRRLAAARDAGTAAVAMEVSSHALVQHRVDGFRFDAAVFTNLSRDHLDYHGSMEAYFAAKALLFEPARTALAVVDTDDPWGRRLAGTLEVPLVTFGLADATEVRGDATGTTFSWRGRRVRLPLAGRFNVANALAAATAAAALGVGEGDVAAGLATAGPVPGRFEVVVAGPPFTGVVDYAHTPDALAAALAGARAVAGPHRVVVVFGCGGDRDQGKRPVMGQVAAAAADMVIVTSDNPRGEDPLAIIDAVVAGTAGGAATVLVEPDRRLAIERAVAAAGDGDVVLVAGKGHETTIETAGLRRPFDDRAELARAAGVAP